PRERISPYADCHADRSNPYLLGLAQGAAAQSICPAGAIRESGESGDRTRVDSRIHRAPDHVPRAAHHFDRHSAQFDRGNDADRRSVETIAAACHGTADATERTATDQRPARAKGPAT